ncbi:MAG: CC/Se motif family (seleno)protein [Solirubrobacterales bacterium]
MNIEFKAKVKEYLYDKNTTDIYIEMDNKGGCCSGPVFVPEVRLGVPEYINMYEPFIHEDITVYIPKKVINEETENISIKLRNMLGQKSLVVNGILAYKDKKYGNNKF